MSPWSNCQAKVRSSSMVRERFLGMTWGRPSILMVMSRPVRFQKPTLQRSPAAKPLLLERDSVTVGPFLMMSPIGGGSLVVVLFGVSVFLVAGAGFGVATGV